MKYLYIATVFLYACGYGQRPRPATDERGWVYDKGRFDSALYYYKQESYYKRLRDKELARINRVQRRQVTDKLFRLDDSVQVYDQRLKQLKK